MKEWPNDRRTSVIALLHCANTPESLRSSAPNRLNLIQGLLSNPTIVDLGMGRGNFLIDLAVLLEKKATLIGITASPSEVEMDQCRNANIKVVKGKLPHDKPVCELLTECQGQVDRVFDTYDPATYAQNPLHSLIFAALLLKENGQFSAISSTDNQENSVFGDKDTQEKIKVLFLKELGIDINFQFTSIKSRVNPGQINTDLLIQFTKNETKLTAKDYLRLCRLADKEIGIPQICNKTWYQYKDFSISPRRYSVFAPYNPQSQNETDQLRSMENSNGR